MKNLSLFYENEYSKINNNHKINSNKLSYIIPYQIIEIITSLTNNIKLNIRNRIYKYVSFIYKDVIIKNKEHKKCNITKNRVLNNIVDRILMLHDDNDIKDEYSEFIEDNRKWLIPIENYHTDVTNYFTYRKVINEYKKKNNKKDLNSSDLTKIRNDNNIITLKHPINNIQDCDLNKFLHSHIKINKISEDYNISAIKENNILFKY